MRGNIHASIFEMQILLRNLNLAGEMKLMIGNDIPKKSQHEAAIKAVNAMNTLQQISITGPCWLWGACKHVQISLNWGKHYSYFVAVTEYEKKIAEGVYNPDIDSIIKQ